MSAKIQSLLDRVLPSNRFYAQKVEKGADFFTTKQELIDDQAAQSDWVLDLRLRLF